MNKKWILIYIFIICKILIHNCYAQNSHVVKEVQVKGNEKTSRNAILVWANIKLGQSIDEEEITNIKEKLMRAAQFNLKHLDFKDGILNIEIEEKWSIFPVPLINQSGEYYARGMLLYENNFLGRLGTFVPGVLWTNSGLNGLLYFQEDSFLWDRIGLKVLLLHKNDLTKFKRKGKTKQEFETRFDTAIVTPNYQRGRHDHKFGPIYVHKRVLNKEHEKLFQSERFGLYYRHHYNKYTKLPVLFDGYVTTIDFFAMPDSWNNMQRVDILYGGDIQYSYPHHNHFFKFQAHYHYTNNKGYLSPKMLGGNEGHRGYDRESIPAQQNLGIMFEEKFHIMGRFYIGSFVEYNIIKTIRPINSGNTLNELSIGANINYFFKKLSVPAIIIEYARNIQDKSHHFNLNIGIRI